ncbi:hypothetical protein DWU98_16550 [Dyella monticola]|uniref:Uncharacterized protein n=1 Tax=Dyella monticola TaxID=1927958 RepID=A0A370WUM8_9GAMM|nr:hypothetical protein DWU98_16550 [Dyella monticola]
MVRTKRYQARKKDMRTKRADWAGTDIAVQASILERSGNTFALAAAGVCPAAYECHAQCQVLKYSACVAMGDAMRLTFR